MANRFWGRRAGALLWVAALAGWVGVAVADVWDPIDQSPLGTANELVHGSEQVHELGPGNDPDPGYRDVDFYRLGERPLASYEVVVDGATWDIVNDLKLERWAIGGSGPAPVQDSLPISGAGKSRSLRWQNTSTAASVASFVRVGSTHACVSCTSAKASYHIRSYETTYSVPRYNNAGTQLTVLMIQNTSDATVAGSAHFWSTLGALQGSLPFNLEPKQLLVQNTAALAFVTSGTGSITVSHDGRYGDLSGKAVALEPATGFAFDTALTPRPR